MTQSQPWTSYGIEPLVAQIGEMRKKGEAKGWTGLAEEEKLLMSFVGILYAIVRNVAHYLPQPQVDSSQDDWCEILWIDATDKRSMSFSIESGQVYLITVVDDKVSSVTDPSIPYLKERLRDFFRQR